jgi:hypothetical protein
LISELAPSRHSETYQLVRYFYLSNSI